MKQSHPKPLRHLKATLALLIYCLCPAVPSLAAGPGIIPKGVTWWWQISNRPSADRPEKVIDFSPNIYTDRVTSDPLVKTFRDKHKEVICYFSAGTSENWREDYAKIDSHMRGNSVNGGPSGGSWKGEKWLNIKETKGKQNPIWTLMAGRMVRAQRLGCTAVEPDNVDAFATNNRTGFGIGKNDSKKFLMFLSETAHRLGMKIGLKNSGDMAAQLEPYFDFAVVEQCLPGKTNENEYECGQFAPFLKNGKAVLQAEYQTYREKFCANAKKGGFSLTFFSSDLILNGRGKSCP